MIIDIAGACSAISDAVCVGSPVIIIIYSKKVNKQVHRKIWNFQLEQKYIGSYPFMYVAVWFFAKLQN